MSFRTIEVVSLYESCGHACTQTKVCSVIPDPRSPTKVKPPRLSFRSLLCGTNPSPEEPAIPSPIHPPKIVQRINGLCSSCQGNEDLRQATASSPRLPSSPCLPQSTMNASSERRRAFRCEKCIRENRFSIDRSANDGLCCEFGRAFWSAQEYRIPSTPASPSTPSIPIPTPPRRHRTQSTTAARAAARAAAQTYGWSPTPDEWNRMDPTLISQFVSTPGCQPASLPAPPKPLYENAMIDLRRWESQVMTPKGSIPAPPPLKPLPERPLRVRSQKEKGKEGNDSDSNVSPLGSPRRVPPGRESPVSPVTTRWPSTARPRRPQGILLPPPLPVLQPLKPKPGEIEESTENVRASMSRIGHDIDDALNSWQQFSHGC